MGTINSRNPVYFDNGQNWRETKQRLYQMKDKLDKLCANGTITPEKFEYLSDSFWAVFDALQAIMLSNDVNYGSKNSYFLSGKHNIIYSEKDYEIVFNRMIKKWRR